MASYTHTLLTGGEACRFTPPCLRTSSAQPLFKALSQLRSGLQDEVGLLSVLDDTVTNLRTFIASQSRLFSEASLDSLLQGSEVKTDQQRMVTSSGMTDTDTPEGTVHFRDVSLVFPCLWAVQVTVLIQSR